MLVKWSEQYRELMLQTRFVSQLGTVWFAVMAILEFCGLCSALSQAYPNEIHVELLWRSVENGLCLIFLFVAFGVRFVLLSRRPPRRYLVVSLSWLCVAIFLTAYVILFDTHP